MSDFLLELKSVSKYYTGNQSVVMGLNGVDLAFRSGEFVAITGESGSGKSTLGQIISGVIPYEGGEMLISGRPTSHYDSSDWERHRREKISFISQSYGILPGNTVEENVISALRITGMGSEEAFSRAEELLKLVELWDLRSRRAGKLSSGQKQRLSIARALAKPAPILVADEPTGNLDPENSGKIITLLAKAARERLVILITHDFQEAEDYATRRIVLQDGRVTVDTPLRPYAPGETMAGRRGKGKQLSPYISWLQLTGRPVWSSLVLLFFALTAFGVFAFLGTFLVNLDDAPTRIYDDSAFRNGDMTRIVVQRLDSEGFTQEDWNTLLSLDHTVSLERNSYLADWQYAWQQDVDYIVHYHVETVGDQDENQKLRIGSVELLLPACDFVQTVPVLREGEKFLTAGRLPETMYEVVLAGSQERIGETFPVYLRDDKTMAVGAYVRIDVTVVGTTDFGTGLYFGEELSQVVNTFVARGGMENAAFLVAPLYDTRFNTLRDVYFIRDYRPEVLPDSEDELIIGMIGNVLYAHLDEIPVILEDGRRKNMAVAGYWHYGGIGIYTEEDSPLPEFSADMENFLGVMPEHQEKFARMVDSIFFRVRPDGNEHLLVDLYLYSDEVCAVSETLFNRGWNRLDLDNGSEGGTLDSVGYHDSTYIAYVNVTKAAFDQIVVKENPNQVSVYISDYAYTDQVIASMQEAGFVALSPFRQGSTRKDPALAAERMNTLQICLAALAAVVLLQLLVLKELFGVQRESYKLLADMGLGCTTARRSVLLQVLLFTVLGQILAFGTVWICHWAEVKRIQAIGRYVNAGGWAMMSAVHLLLCLVSGVLITRSLSKKIYPQSGRNGDLDLEEDEEVAAI